MNELYPLKFKPILKDKIWGGKKIKNLLNKAEASEKCGESWEISGIDGNLSVVSEGFLEGNDISELIEIYMGDLVGDKVYELFGNTFPLLVKYIDANDFLSIQVHPDDLIAEERHNSFGKTEMWYVIQSDPGSKLISGLNKKLSKATYTSLVEKGQLESVLNFEEAKAGDVFYIPAGRIHSIGKGLLIAEIQQSSDITYRIYDFNRKDQDGNTRELHTQQALEAIDFNVYDEYKTIYPNISNQTVNAISSRYFNTNIMNFNKAVEKDFALLDSFVIYMCTLGECEILYGEDKSVIFKKGETVLIPAALKNLVINPKTNSTVLEVYIK